MVRQSWVSRQRKAGGMTIEPLLAGVSPRLAVNPVPGDLQRRRGAGYDRRRTATPPQVALAQGAAPLQEGDPAIDKLSVLQQAAVGLAGVAPWQNRIMEPLLAGNHNNNPVNDRGTSHRLVESHRGPITRRVGAERLSALARLALGASWTDTPDLVRDWDHRSRDPCQQAMNRHRLPLPATQRTRPDAGRLNHSPGGLS